MRDEITCLGLCVCIKECDMRNMKVALSLGCAVAAALAVTTAHAQQNISLTEPTYFVKPAQTSVTPGGTLAVQVFLANATDVGAVQVQVAGTDSQNNKLTITDIKVDKQQPTFIFGLDQIVEAIDMHGKRLALVLYNGGAIAPAAKPRYVGTFSLAIPADATGSISVGVAIGQETMLLASSGAAMTYTADSPVTVQVVTDRVRPTKRGRRTR